MNIKELLNFGIGKKAIIIANGTSVNEFDFNFDYSKYTIFGINCYKPIPLDFLIYYDKDRQEYFNINGLQYKTKLIGFELNASIYCNYTYNTKDINFCDSGNHAIQIASNIMKFDKIYLIGYDYYPMNKYIHYFDFQKANEDVLNNYDKVIFNKALHKYYKPFCICSNEHLLSLEKDNRGMYNCICKEKNIFDNKNIYNCNEKSNLKLFPYINFKGVVNE